MTNQYSKKVLREKIQDLRKKVDIQNGHIIEYDKKIDLLKIDKEKVVEYKEKLKEQISQMKEDIENAI